jgi:hypothetical protein
VAYFFIEERRRRCCRRGWREQWLPAWGGAAFGQFQWPNPVARRPGRIFLLKKLEWIGRRPGPDISPSLYRSRMRFGAGYCLLHHPPRWHTSPAQLAVPRNHNDRPSSDAMVPGAPREDAAHPTPANRHSRCGSPASRRVSSIARQCRSRTCRSVFRNGRTAKSVIYARCYDVRALGDAIGRYDASRS